jgi:hypothetical protein
MHTRHAALILSAVLALPLALAAQAHQPAPPPQHASQPAEPTPPLTDKDVATIQRQLIDLLRLSPTLTTVVARDPSLLADTDYVQRNNPQLADFLKAHPEVARNPDFYLFTHLPPDAGGPDEALERAVWPDVYHEQYRRTGFDEFFSNLPPLLAFVAFLLAAIWGIRVFVENRRWSRTFKLQSDVHGRLIDKFSSSQELAAYMQTEAGRHFLEAAPIPTQAESPRIPNAVSRVLTPVQVGVVLILLGIGFLLIRHAGPDYETPMLVLGVLILMPGIGFILSAGITWFMANRMGLMPPPGSRLNPPYSER